MRSEGEKDEAKRRKKKEEDEKKKKYREKAEGKKKKKEKMEEEEEQQQRLSCGGTDAVRTRLSLDWSIRRWMSGTCGRRPTRW